jgi:hypothetical protein
MFEFGFDPLNFHEVMAHGLREILRIVSFCTLVHSPTPWTAFAVSDSYKYKFSFALLGLFLIEYTTGSGLSIACNTLRMLV